jgi:hypothetical protein
VAELLALSDDKFREAAKHWDVPKVSAEEFDAYEARLKSLGMSFYSL